MTQDSKNPLFNTGAAVYDTFRSLHPPADRISALAKLEAGHRVLDIACGSGRATLVAAERVGETGKVIGIDIADKLLEVARQKADALSLHNVEFLLNDAHHPAFDDSYFDRVLCASSMYLFKDMQAVISEAYRVLKPGGVFVFSVFEKSMFQPVTDMIETCLSQYDAIEFPAPVFSVTDSPEKCMDIILGAGLRTVEIFVEHLTFTVESVDDCWRQVAASLLVRPRLAVLDKESYQQVKQEVLEQVAGMMTGEGLSIEVPVIFCRVTKN